MKDKSGNTLYAVLSDGPGETPVDALRFAMAQEALNDPEWRQLYDEVQGSVFGFPENLPALIASTSELPTLREAETSLLGQWTGSANHCAAPLRLRALELGMEPRSQVSDMDTVASVVGAELWCAALAVTDLSRAASLGVDSISSLAAILARASGYPVHHGGTLPEGRVDATFSLERVDLESDTLLQWARDAIGRSGAMYALETAVKDLSYRAEGDSLSFQTALRVKARHLPTA